MDRKNWWNVVYNVNYINYVYYTLYTIHCIRYIEYITNNLLANSIGKKGNLFRGKCDVEMVMFEQTNMDAKKTQNLLEIFN